MIRLHSHTVANFPPILLCAQVVLIKFGDFGSLYWAMEEMVSSELENSQRLSISNRYKRGAHCSDYLI